RFKTLSVWLSILTVLNDLHHPAQGGLRRTRTLDLAELSINHCRVSCVPAPSRKVGAGRRLPSLIETAKLNGVEPQAYIADVIARIVSGHPNSRMDELLPWAYPAQAAL
ncbi:MULTISPECIES: transposase domain-containing protein, partial [Bosea]|uniref:transposase domain-containing protein n=1 Tax=Bosea TaxID=85413 RepID=UPI00286D1A53